MVKVGITGNYFSGYGDIALIFGSKGVPVFDADVVLKFILNYSEDAIAKICSRFPNAYRDSFLDTKLIDSDEKFDKVLDIVYLDLIKAYDKWRFNHKLAPYTIFKSAIIFERHIDQYTHYNINVYKPKSDRKFLINLETDIPMLKIQDILDKEMDELKKNKSANYVINNYDAYQPSIDRQVEAIHKKILEKCKVDREIPKFTSSNMDKFVEYNGLLM